MFGKTLIIEAILILFTFSALSQNLSLAAFHNYQGHFIIFDSGKTHDVENLPVQSFQIGGNCIAYISNAGNFKVYYKEKVITLSDQPSDKYFATRNIMVWFLFDQLYVFDNGKNTLLSSNVKNFAIGDSIIAYLNRNTNTSYVYYKGKKFTLEKSLTGDPIKKFKAGNNLFAYFNDNTKYFKIFYQSNLENILQTNDLIEFKAGQNIVAFIDNSNDYFQVFYKGDIIDVEDFKPKSYKVGDDLLAYVGNLDEFKVFYKGEVQEISSFEPDIYEVVDSLVVYSEQGYFKVYYDGKIYELENYIPENFQIQECTVAYIDLNGWLKSFSRGKQFFVTKDIVKAFKLSYNTIMVNTTVNTIKIYYKGSFLDTK